MLEKRYDFNTREKHWQEYWREQEIYKFNPEAKNRYMIDTPPPTISGIIHLGHVFSYTQIDVIARHQRMLGKSVFFPFGYDDNGLPTERYVQREKKVKMAETSRQDFINLCLDTTKQMKANYEEVFSSAGHSADFSHAYSSISPRTQEISQRSFIELYNKSEIERRNSACLWCPECRTAIAQSEVDTVEMPSLMNYIYFTIKETGEKLRIATTRPELLCACVCVFVHPDDNERANLVGKTAISPYYNREVPIIANPDVDMEKGTGAVMCCTFGDEADAKWQKEYNLPVLEGIGYNGRMTDLAGEFAGQKVREARENIINKLKELGLLYDQQELTHLVATHERCGTEVELLIKPQWFIKMLEHKDEIYRAGEQVKWNPEYAKKRFLNWVDGLKWDWCISRQRFFGVPFPVWYCAECGEPMLADTSDLPVDPSTTQPHKPCSKCGYTHFNPETDVMDTWATSSLTPQICTDVITNKGLDDTYIPMDLRPNAHENIRVWDFYTIAKSLLHFGKLPWHDVMISGWGLSATGTKLSKSKSSGGTPTPLETYKKYSADVTRYWASNASLGKDVYIKEEEFKDGFKLMQKIWNASRFVLSFLEGYTPHKPAEILPMDKWIIEEYKKTFKAFMSYMDRYEMGLALNELEQLFWNFCDNYIEIAKNRLYKPEIYGEQAKESAQYAASTVLLGILKLFSIYMPHITEEIYQAYYAEIEGCKSIHISNYLDLGSNIDEQLLKNGAEVCDIVSQVRGYKSQNNLSMKDEIAAISLAGYNEFVRTCEDDIKAVCSIQTINYTDGEKAVTIE